MEHAFRVYISDEREYFEYSTATGMKKRDFPLLESLLDLLDLDIWPLEPVFKKISKTILRLHQEPNALLLDDILHGMEELSRKHIYFEFLLWDWQQRLDALEESGWDADALNSLPRKSIEHIPSEIDCMQKQVRLTIEKALDILTLFADRPAAERLALHADYVGERGATSLELFQFRPLSTRYEKIGSAYTEVLYPRSIYDMVDFFLRESIRRELKLRVCKNCGRYFVLTGRASAEYCDRAADEKGRTCKVVGSAKQWGQKSDSDKVFQAYRKEYKKRFARIKAGKLPAAAFYEWGDAARVKKKECDEGTITLDEFKAWLEQS